LRPILIEISYISEIEKRAAHRLRSMGLLISLDTLNVFHGLDEVTERGGDATLKRRVAQECRREACCVVDNRTWKVDVKLVVP